MGFSNLPNSSWCIAVVYCQSGQKGCLFLSNTSYAIAQAGRTIDRYHTTPHLTSSGRKYARSTTRKRRNGGLLRSLFCILPTPESESALVSVSNTKSSK
jgi:hypothetical protein